MKVVYQDVWQPSEALVAVRRGGHDVDGREPPPSSSTHRRQQQQRRDTSAGSSFFICGGAPFPRTFVAEADQYLGAELVAVWGMTENGIVTTTTPGDPARSWPTATARRWTGWRSGWSTTDGARGRPWARSAVSRCGARARPWATSNGPTSTPRRRRRRRLVRHRRPGSPPGRRRYPHLGTDEGPGHPRRRERAGRRDRRLSCITHPKVREVAVVGYPDDRLGERACAVVVVPRWRAPRRSPS